MPRQVTDKVEFNEDLAHEYALRGKAFLGAHPKLQFGFTAAGLGSLPESAVNTSGEMLKNAMLGTRGSNRDGLAFIFALKVIAGEAKRQGRFVEQYPDYLFINRTSCSRCPKSP